MQIPSLTGSAMTIGSVSPPFQRSSGVTVSSMYWAFALGWIATTLPVKTVDERATMRSNWSGAVHSHARALAARVAASPAANSNATANAEDRVMGTSKLERSDHRGTA